MQVVRLLWSLVCRVHNEWWVVVVKLRCLLFNYAICRAIDPTAACRIVTAAFTEHKSPLPAQRTKDRLHLNHLQMLKSSWIKTFSISKWIH